MMKPIIISIIIASITFSLVVICLIYLIGSKTGNFDFAFSQIGSASLKAIPPALISFIFCYAALRNKSARKRD